MFLALPFTPPGAGTDAAFFSDPFLGDVQTAGVQNGFWPDHLKYEKRKGRKMLGEGGMEGEQEAGVKGPWDCPVRVGVVGVSELFGTEGRQGGVSIFGKGERGESRRGFIRLVFYLWVFFSLTESEAESVWDD